MSQISRPTTFVLRVLATDLDGTLIPLAGNEQNRRDLLVLRQHLSAHSMTLTFVTGRHLSIVEDAITEHDLPEPDWIICDVGTSVYQSVQGHWSEMAAYHEHLNTICQGLPLEDLKQQLERVDGLKLQEEEKQGPFKLSFYVLRDELQTIASKIDDLLKEQEAPWSLISSVDPFTNDGLIDLLPRGVSKAYAIEWWRQHCNFERQEIAFSGDSGNDFAALVAGYHSIIVGNADRQLVESVQEHHQVNGWTDRLHLAEAVATSGVVEGLREFGVSQRVSPQVMGATILPNSRTEFAVWAPTRSSVDVVIEKNGAEILFPLESDIHGHFRGVIEGVEQGTDYAYRLDKSLTRPDPRSRYQPEGVHGRSQVVDPSAFEWKDHSWAGIAKSDLIIYELHVGTFSEAGTFQAATRKLDELQELGITAVEIMPVAQAPGRANWGYDGVNLFAPSNNYGTPDDFRAFVDAAHASGLAVILDVVYNHLGPEGNYLSDFGPYFSETHHTPWGEAFNFDGPNAGPVRQLILDNALYWLDEFHLDGLRLDAVDAMHDTSEEHILLAIRKAVSSYAATVDRRIHLFAEANRYDQRLIRPADDECEPYDAIWCDDIMHSIYAVSAPDALHVERPYHPTDLTESLLHGYIYSGPPEHRVTSEERTRLHPDGTGDELHSLIIALQNHDVVGNDAYGRRFHQLTSRDAQMAAAALVMLYPSIPLIFMGEEYAASSPFSFFTDFGDEQLRQAVNQGRAREYPDYENSNCILATDPQAFWGSKLLGEPDNEVRDWYRSLIRMRKTWRSSGILCAERLTTYVLNEHQTYALQYRGDDDKEHFVIARLPSLEAQSELVTVRVNGTRELQNCVTSVDGETVENEVQLTVNGILIGTGSFTFENC